jgi:hypothetical protein
MTIAAGLLLLGMAGLGRAGEPLVKKNTDGSFAPALASEWAKMGDTLKIILRPGLRAVEVAAELKPKLDPVAVEATDDSTLVLRAQPLDEKAVLEKLSQLPLASGADRADGLAALVAMGKDGEPSLSDLSSDGSIRASKKIDIPGEEKKPWGPRDVAGKVVKVLPCEPLPTIELQVTATPTEGEHKAAFKAGEKILVHGFYQIDDKTRKIVRDEARTRVNLESYKLKPGAVIFGKPFLKDKDVWVLETINQK